MLGAIVRFKSGDEWENNSAHPSFQNKTGYVISYAPRAPDGHAHIRVRWFGNIPHPQDDPQPVVKSDFRLERFEILSHPDT